MIELAELPKGVIQTILFKSYNKMPVLLLFAVTLADKALEISPTSPKPEKTFQTDTSGWIPFEPSEGSIAGTALDMSFLLDPPAGKHGKIKNANGTLSFEDGTPARFWGIQLSGEWWNLTDEQLSKAVGKIAAMGCNLVSLDDTAGGGVTARLKDLAETLKSKGIYLDLSQFNKQRTPETLLADPAVIVPDGQWTSGQAFLNDPSQDKADVVEFQDDPMVLHPEDSLPCRLIFSRTLGQPYWAQWREGWPQEYLAESPLLLSAFGDFEDWSACVGMGAGNGDWENRLSPDIDLWNKPMMMAQWPVAALVYLRGELLPGRMNVLHARDSKPELDTALRALAHCSGLDPGNGAVKTDPAGTLKAKLQPQLKSFVTDTGQIHWQGNVGLAQISTPRFQAVIGFLGDRKLSSPVWQVESPNYFASLSLISLTKTNLWASDHLLLTGVARMENSGEIYNAVKTKLMSPGKAPILMEPLQAKITIFRYKKDPKLKVRALDMNGRILQNKIPIKWSGNHLQVTWFPGVFYLELYKN